jgi:hypothetical protein
VQHATGLCASAAKRFSHRSFLRSRRVEAFSWVLLATLAAILVVWLYVGLRGIAAA